MPSRRDFLKKVSLLAAGGGAAGSFPAAIQRAMAIDPAPGTTFLDAEHVVILMQENRSFDHCYGALRGVRGFSDPRAIDLPNGNPVWLQTNAAGETYAPFRLNITETKSTWMSCLPHSWPDQTAARNEGRHDGWLEAKASARAAYAGMPLTLGHYTREDLPFYYALADAFTVCDQNFCSSLTATTPNRLYLWTGTVRKEQTSESMACVRSSEVDYGSEATWTTFPERLEDLGISWRVYQNEISLPTGLSSEEESWLSNFTDNPLEWFTQYGVRFSPAHRAHLQAKRQELAAAQAALEEELKAAAPAQPPAELVKVSGTAKALLDKIDAELAQWSEEKWNALPAKAKALHQRAFTTNGNDPDFRKLEKLTYQDGGEERGMSVPKGDVLYQLREDVRTGKLPAVSWLVAPQLFSDHPDSPWYGTWYLAEALEILTKDPEVWKKTIFILCYDENDGYYDHVPPFVPPVPGRPETGAAPEELNAALDQVASSQENAYRQSHPKARIFAGPIGLGFRVPLVVASPWSRGGMVCSQVFDHTSILQFLEVFLSHKTGKAVRETNISPWRRAVCGDLTSVFRPWHGEKMDFPEPVIRGEFLKSIHQAKFRPVPTDYRRLTPEDIALARENPRGADFLPRQEPGTRPSCALPYELSVNGRRSADGKHFSITFAAGKERFGGRSAGAPFHVYAPGHPRMAGQDPDEYEHGNTRAYATRPGVKVSGDWKFDRFIDGLCHLRVHGPNGFFREFRAKATDPALDIKLSQPSPAEGGDEAGFLVRLTVTNHSAAAVQLTVDDPAYRTPARTFPLAAGGVETLQFSTAAASGWHDLHVRLEGSPHFLQRFAGRMETGKPGISDPAMDPAWRV
ncbi:MAG: phospholipase C, phosphocholine-specific [Verrucomicrobiota bacterium]